MKGLNVKREKRVKGVTEGQWTETKERLFSINQHWSCSFLLIHHHLFSWMLCGASLQLAAGQKRWCSHAWAAFLSSCSSCHHGASWLLRQPETPEELLSCHSSALLLPARLSAPLPCSVICSPPSSFSLINALIKGATSKSRLQGRSSLTTNPKGNALLPPPPSLLLSPRPQLRLTFNSLYYQLVWAQTTDLTRSRWIEPLPRLNLNNCGAYKGFSESTRVLVTQLDGAGEWSDGTTRGVELEQFDTWRSFKKTWLSLRRIGHLVLPANEVCCIRNTGSYLKNRVLQPYSPRVDGSWSLL